MSGIIALQLDITDTEACHLMPDIRLPLVPTMDVHPQMPRPVSDHPRCHCIFISLRVWGPSLLSQIKELFPDRRIVQKGTSTCFLHYSETKTNNGQLKTFPSKSAWNFFRHEFGVLISVLRNSAVEFLALLDSTLGPRSSFRD
jgi:hypothetical protein